MIKDQTRKRTSGVYFFKDIPQDLKDTFDDSAIITDPLRLGII